MTTRTQPKGRSQSLIVLTEKAANDHQFKVYWGTGSKKQGLFTVTVNIPESANPVDERIIAELSVMHHILDFNNAIGWSTVGEDTTLKVSCGAIRKLWMRAGDRTADSSKAWMGRYAAFLLGRFVDSDVSTSTDKTWMRPDIETCRSETLLVTEPLPSLLGMGHEKRPAVITLHASRKFLERCTTSSMSVAWLALMHALQRSRPIPADNAKRLQKESHRARREQESGDYWGDPMSKWVFVVNASPDKKYPEVLTAYCEPKMFRL